MHPRALDAREIADGAGQFPFQRAQMVDVLYEIRRGEGIALVEDLVADAAAGRQALAGEIHAQPADIALGHENRLPVIARLVADAAQIKVAQDGGGILKRQVGVEQGQRRL